MTSNSSSPSLSELRQGKRTTQLDNNMLDITFIREQREIVEQAIRDKAMDVDLDRLLQLDEQRRELITQRDTLLAERNQLAIEQAKERGPAIKAELAQIEPQLASVQREFDTWMLQVPQIPAADAVRGAAELAAVVKQIGEPPAFAFTPLDHIQLGERLDLIDTDRGTAVSGYRGYFLKNEAVLIHHGLMQLTLQTMKQRGFTLMVPPTVIKEHALIGSGHFPFGKDEIYQIGNPGRLSDGSERKDPAYLAGTAEPSLLAYYADRVVDLADLPLKLCGISQCYRSEVGGYGRDTHGLYRLHEFMKVEQVIITNSD